MATIEYSDASLVRHTIGPIYQMKIISLLLFNVALSSYFVGFLKLAAIIQTVK